MLVNNKTFAITGAGNGMGRELALELLRRGARVAAIDLNLTALEETMELSNGHESLSIHEADIANQNTADALPETIIARHGSIDGIINNAGIIQPFVRVNKLDFNAIHRVMNVNFYGTLYMTKAFLPYLLQRPEAHIANVSSMGGFLPVPGQTIYGASKAAVKLFTEGLYAELIDTKVHVTVIFPGAVATNITANSGVAIPAADEAGGNAKFNPLPATTAAKLMIEGIENNKLYVYVGKDASFMNLLYRLNPGFATRYISKKMKTLLKD